METEQQNFKEMQIVPYSWSEDSDPVSEVQSDLFVEIDPNNTEDLQDNVNAFIDKMYNIEPPEDMDSLHHAFFYAVQTIRNQLEKAFAGDCIVCRQQHTFD